MTTVSRTWFAEIQLARADEYERFAREVSLPMFQSHPGCIGVLMIREYEQCRVTTIWSSAEAAEEFQASAIYRATVQRILDQGFLIGEQSVQVARPHIVWFRDTED